MDNSLCFRNGGCQQSAGCADGFLGAEDTKGTVSNASLDFGYEKEAGGMREKGLQEVRAQEQPKYYPRWAEYDCIERHDVSLPNDIFPL